MHKEKKRILLLGSSIWKDIIVEYAEKNNIELIFAGNTPSELDNIVKEYYRIDSTNREAMIPFIKSLHVDGVFMGGSELIVSHACEYVNELGFPCYCTKEQWDLCQNKQAFKNMCRQYGVPCVPEFSQDDDPSTYDYPIIVKPTDSCSAKGITVCYSPEEYKVAISHALEYSTEKKFIIEKFIENRGTTMSVRYIAVDGELYLEAVGDRYVLDANRGKALITAAAFYPSKYTEQYIRDVDEKVKAMFKGIGIKNGAFFMESIANPDGIWFYEMGLRVSGGQTYKITEQITGINELKMLINYACTGKMCEKEETKRIDPFLKGLLSASFTIPLREGTIATAEGVDAIKSIPETGAIVQYWKPGDTIMPKHIGTLDQLFCRIPVIVKGKERLAEIMQEIKQTLSVKDEQGNEMIIWSKLNEIYNDYMQ
jgi:glutathione synthase/RimK-type ligase-like ATP-grasp enzyme